MPLHIFVTCCYALVLFIIYYLYIVEEERYNRCHNHRRHHHHWSRQIKYYVCSIWWCTLLMSYHSMHSSSCLLFYFTLIFFYPAFFNMPLYSIAIATTYFLFLAFLLLHFCSKHVCALTRSFLMPFAVVSECVDFDNHLNLCNLLCYNANREKKKRIPHTTHRWSELAKENEQNWKIYQVHAKHMKIASWTPFLLLLLIIFSVYCLFGICFFYFSVLSCKNVETHFIQWSVSRIHFAQVALTNTSLLAVQWQRKYVVHVSSS